MYTQIGSENSNHSVTILLKYFCAHIRAVLITQPSLFCAQMALGARAVVPLVTILDCPQNARQRDFDTV